MINRLISIIIPVYRSEKYLHECVDSLLIQTYTNWELILVDDGSPDKSGEICDEYAAKESRIRVVHKKNEGVGAARNVGIEIATGDNICFIDSDDTIDANYLETLIYVDECDLVVSGYIVDEYDTDDKHQRSVRYNCGNFVYREGNDKERLSQPFASGIMHMNWNKLFNLDIIRKYNIRYKPYFVNEDFIFVLNYLLHCKSITFIDNCLYHWIRREGVISGVESMPDNIINIYEESHELLAEYLHNELLADSIMYRTYDMLIYKFFFAYRDGKISENTCFSFLKRIYKSELARKTFKIENATTYFTKLVCILHSIGWFKISFFMHKYLIWR